MSKSAHPETTALVKEILADIGCEAKFIDLAARGYRVKLGGTTEEKLPRLLTSIQKKLDASGWSEIKIKRVGSPYGPPTVGFVVPFID